MCIWCQIKLGPEHTSLANTQVSRQMLQLLCHTHKSHWRMRRISAQIIIPQGKTFCNLFLFKTNSKDIWSHFFLFQQISPSSQPMKMYSLTLKKEIWQNGFSFLTPDVNIDMDFWVNMWIGWSQNYDITRQESFCYITGFIFTWKSYFATRLLRTFQKCCSLPTILS